MQKSTIKHHQHMLRLGVSILFGMLFFQPLIVSAQQGITLSVTPPLIQLSVNPGDSWQSFIKIANVNSYDLNLYATVVNFSASGEDGTGRFTPLLAQSPEDYGASLAQWIEVSNDAIFIPEGKTVQVPFSIVVPENASPGGHYAAILIGTQPLRDGFSGSGVAVSSLVSTLIFARITGNVIEKGDIREFSSDNIFYETPEVEFLLRFQNSGNVHLQPQGDITIYNMWGKQRGIIPINQETEFGNVLPESTRKYQFTWIGENNPLEVGRYSAIATLTYGRGSRQSVSSNFTFWVVPIVPVFSVVGGLALFILFTTWAIRRYIHRAFMLEAERLTGTKDAAFLTADIKPRLTRPLIDGVMDLRNARFSGIEDDSRNHIHIFELFKRYRLFTAFIIIVFLAIALSVLYFKIVLAPERSFEIDTSKNERETLIIPTID